MKVMNDAILVINAGSSSLKFAGYVDGGGAEPDLIGKGQIEGLGTAPHFTVKDDDGNKVDEYRWPEGEAVSHADGLEYLINWIEKNATDVRVVAVAQQGIKHGDAVEAGETAPLDGAAVIDERADGGIAD